MNVKGDSHLCCSCDNIVSTWYVRLYGLTVMLARRSFAREGGVARVWTCSRAIALVSGHGLVFQK